jgi:hypothetical protein
MYEKQQVSIVADAQMTVGIRNRTSSAHVCADITTSAANIAFLVNSIINP